VLFVSSYFGHDAFRPVHHAIHVLDAPGKVDIICALDLMQTTVIIVFYT